MKHSVEGAQIWQKISYVSGDQNRTHGMAAGFPSMRACKYEPRRPDRNGVIKSEAYPGLWLDVPALLEQNLAAVLARLQRGLNSREHKALLRKLKHRQN